VTLETRGAVKNRRWWGEATKGKGTQEKGGKTAQGREAGTRPKKKKKNGFQGKKGGKNKKRAGRRLWGLLSWAIKKHCRNESGIKRRKSNSKRRACLWENSKYGRAKSASAMGRGLAGEVWGEKNL